MPIATRDGWDLSAIEATLVYFVPRDRTPLADWRTRAEFYARRLEAFHARELTGQSALRATVAPAPVRSPLAAWELRLADPTFTFHQIIGEVEHAVRFPDAERVAFPVLIVLSDINWRELDDFWRLRPTAAGPVFDGVIAGDRHTPGSPSGGSLAAYVPTRGVGLALVSADGWRVPYRGSDCVVYHEGIGHAIGLGHPADPDGSVMSHGQYRGELRESWLAGADKRALGWIPASVPPATAAFTGFGVRALPAVPTPGEAVALGCTWPAGARVVKGRVAWQCDLHGGWTSRALTAGAPPGVIALDVFAAPTPVSYRVEAVLADGSAVDAWGYVQVRVAPELAPLPAQPLAAPDAPLDGDLITVIATRRAGTGDLVVPVSGTLVVTAPGEWYELGRPTAVAWIVNGASVRVLCDGRVLDQTSAAPAPSREDLDHFGLDELRASSSIERERRKNPAMLART